ncbi:MAG: futalosine synthase [Thermodesulfovibrio sp.]|nr:futalosine synthase [Thermodesulfovibrio sp.]
MKKNKLRIGRIPYANLFPIFYTLETEFDCSSYEFAEGVPSKLNRMLNNGEVDLSPSSSIEYLRNPSLYRYIDGISISSRGPVGSIFLFSTKPIADLNDCTVYVSSQSATSIGLLHVILNKFYGLNCSLQSLNKPEDSGKETFLLIGDDAIRLGSQKPQQKGKLIYDLGEIWYKHTGLPFVFALWIVRRELYGEKDYRHGLFNKFTKDLSRAKDIALRNLPEIAKHSPMKRFMSEGDIISYWNKLDYELSDEHKKGLELFNKYLKELSYF